MELRAVEADLERTYQRSVELVERGTSGETSLPEMPRASSVHEKLEVLSAQNRALWEQNRELREQTVLAHALGTEMHAGAIKHGKVLVEINSLLYNEEHWISIADSEPAGAQMVDDAFYLEIFRPQLLPAAVDPERIRDWILPSELQKLVAVSHNTVPRWLRGVGLPSPAPWFADAIPVDESLGLGYRRIWVPGIDENFWPSELVRERLEEVLAEWPRVKGWWSKGQPTARCSMPLQLPDAVTSASSAILLRAAA
jgi:hypothetical protein